MTQKIKPISQTYKQQHSLDRYGYPLPPDSRRRLRKTTLHTSKSILNIFIYLMMSFLGGLFWLGRMGKKYPPLTTQNKHRRHILVIRLDLIGDHVLSMTTVRALKHTYPDEIGRASCRERIYS